jgi:phage tail tape-measure protein
VYKLSKCAALEANDVGVLVGAKVGEGVGLELGRLVGPPVGTLEGSPVGMDVGAEVGAALYDLRDMEEEHSPSTADSHSTKSMNSTSPEPGGVLATRVSWGTRN